MTLKLKIEADLKAAMLARESFTVDTLRGIKSVILDAEIKAGKRQDGLSDTEIEQILVREVKKRDEAAALFEQGGNAESATKELSEKQLIAEYLPSQLSEDEIQKHIDEAVAKMNPQGMADMGKVIGAVKSKTGTSADGSIIAKLVKETILKR